MLTSLTTLFAALSSVFRSRSALQLENLALRHQISVLQRTARKRPKLTLGDRLLWVWLSRIWSGWRSALAIVKPETVIAWHRGGFRRFWTWKVRRGRAGRPVVAREVRHLIRRMCRENPSWGAPRIHGELLKLGINIAESSVSKYMVRCRKPPSQTWRTFLENHVQQLVSIDFFTVPTIRFQILYLFLVLAHDRRRILHFNVTAHPTAEWTAQQLREAFPLTKVPATCCATAMQSLAITFESRYETWASAKSYVHRTLLGRGHMSSARLVPFDVSVWTLSSCSMKPPCVELSLVISGTITERGRTFHWGRTRPSRDQFNRRKWDTLWRCRKWAGYTTAMNDEPPEQHETRLLCCRFRFRYHAEQRSSPQLLAMRTAATVGI